MDEINELPKVEIGGQPAMAPAKNVAQSSPLEAYYRQPKIYMRLPSKGEYYPEDSLDKSEDGTYAVYSMTARDELMFKTPDALLSGQSTVEVIRSCIPAIKDPWKIPSIDLDAILVAIRIATYGDKMEIDTNCTKCKEEQRYDFNLTQYLEELGNFQYTKTFPVGELVVHIRPFTYKEATKRQIANIEQEKIYNIVNDQNMSDEEKLERFGVSFVKLTELTVETIADVVHRIDTPQGSETDIEKIRNIVRNAPKEVFDTINNELVKMKEKLDLRVKNAKCDKCDHTFDIAVTMDQANFFAVRS